MINTTDPPTCFLAAYPEPSVETPAAPPEPAPVRVTPTAPAWLWWVAATAIVVLLGTAGRWGAALDTWLGGLR